MGALAIAGLTTAGSMLAYPLVERLFYGSREDQMRDQMRIQEEFERERMGGAGGDMAGLMGGPVGPRPSIGMLAEEDEFLKGLLSARDEMEQVERAGATASQFSPELQKLLAGEEARIRQLQSERTLTPYEILQLVGL